MLKNPEAAAPWISDMLADALKSRSRSSNGCRASQTRERERERERANREQVEL